MIYYVYGIDKKNFNSHQHNNVAALKTAIVYAVANVPNTHLVSTKISRGSLEIELSRLAVVSMMPSNVYVIIYTERHTEVTLKNALYL